MAGKGDAESAAILSCGYLIPCVLKMRETSVFFLVSLSAPLALRLWVMPTGSMNITINFRSCEIFYFLLFYSPLRRRLLPSTAIGTLQALFKRYEVVAVFRGSEAAVRSLRSHTTPRRHDDILCKTIGGFKRCNRVTIRKIFMLIFFILLFIYLIFNF
jgi:hypothetical protein